MLSCILYVLAGPGFAPPSFTGGLFFLPHPPSSLIRRGSRLIRAPFAVPCTEEMQPVAEAALGPLWDEVGPCHTNWWEMEPGSRQAGKLDPPWASQLQDSTEPAGAREGMSQQRSACHAALPSFWSWRCQQACYSFHPFFVWIDNDGSFWIVSIVLP